MKKIGILFGMENTFPQAFVDRVNQKGVEGIKAEFVRIDKILQGEPLDYAVIVDRISQDVPFYRASMKNAAICGTAVINNPFWWSADEKFFNNALALKVGVPVPKTVLLPSKEQPTGTSDTSFRNLAMPLDWDNIFNYVGFPAYMKPYDGGGWRDVYKLYDKEDFFDKFNGTGQLVMLLQEEIQFDDYFRCYCIGGNQVRIMRYEPRNPHHLRYVVDREAPSAELLATVEDYVIRLNEYLGYDMNTVEFAIRDGIPIAIDFCNPAPDADRHTIGEENFEWVVETMANYAIERAQNQKEGQDNLTWGRFVRSAVAGTSLGDALPVSGAATRGAGAELKIRRRSKKMLAAEGDGINMNGEESNPVPKKSPGRPKKEASEKKSPGRPKKEASARKSPGRPKKEGGPNSEAGPKKAPGRPRKEATSAMAPDAIFGDDSTAMPKRSPGRPKKLVAAPEEIEVKPDIAE